MAPFYPYYLACVVNKMFRVHAWRTLSVACLERDRMNAGGGYYIQPC